MKTAGHIKGALLEYIIRNLLKSCGFTNAIEDKLFLFESRGLFYINGKGAAHDADILMNPPIQMPFIYPTQILFECKAYKTKPTLPVVRGALGLRNDINDFEIVTKESILKRQNNKRSHYAIDNRTRYIYQIGVASVNEFSNSAVEFAANNKIPLLTLSWFLKSDIIEKFNKIDQSLIDKFDENKIDNLYKFLKDRNGNIEDQRNSPENNLLKSNSIFYDIITAAENSTKYSYIGLLETGDMVFIKSHTHTVNNVLYNNSTVSFNAEIHWRGEEPNLWKLTINNTYSLDDREFDFYLPKRIFDQWEQFSLDKKEALNIKQQYFSKIFVFNRKNDSGLPFTIINLDKEWFNRAKEELNRSCK